MNPITSVQNPLIKEIKRLQSPAVRRETGVFLLEGMKLCEEALRCNIEIIYVFYGDDPRAAALAEQCPADRRYLVSDAVIAKLSEAKTPQHIVMVGKIPTVEAAQISGSMVLALDGISDPANLGSMLRTAEAFGVKDILCSDATVDLYNTKVLRGAMGSSFRVRVHRGKLKETMLALKEDGYHLYATGLLTTHKMLQNIDFSEKCVVVIGNEGNGVTDEIFDICECGILIPMCGQNESLNAAAATAVVLWQGYKGQSHE